MTEVPYLGVRSQRIDVVLQAGGSSFHAVLNRKDGIDWLVDEQLELRFNTGDAYPATLAGTTASFHLSDAQLNVLIAKTPVIAELWYTAPGGDPVRWASGSVDIEPA